MEFKHSLIHKFDSLFFKLTIIKGEWIIHKTEYTILHSIAHEGIIV
jgi:hypothetical protein